MPVPTRLQFETYGMSSLDDIPSSAWDQLEGPITIHMYSEEAKINPRIEIAKREMTYLLTQTAGLVPKGDVKKVELTMSGPVKAIVSRDGGETWGVYGTEWASIEKTDLEAVKTNAMTMAQVAAIPQTAWAGVTDIRFGFLVDIVSHTDVATISSVKLTTIPDALTTPSVGLIGLEVKELSIEGRMKELERMNSIQLAKLNFKAGAILGADQLMLHNMQVDLFDTDTAETVTVTTGQTEVIDIMDGEPEAIEDGSLYVVHINDIRNPIKKIEVI